MTEVLTEKCVSSDLTDPEHDRCVGAVFESVFEQGKPCECACHSLPRCFTPYVGHGANVYDCKLHEGHGGRFHRSGYVLWSV